VILCPPRVGQLVELPQFFLEYPCAPELVAVAAQGIDGGASVRFEPFGAGAKRVP
jgi:hypothetical protein